MRWIYVFACALAFATLGQGSHPHSLARYEQVGVGYVNAAVGRAVLSEHHIDGWTSVLNADEGQMQAIRSAYAGFVVRHNEFMDREMPAYLEKSAAAGALQAAEGLRSPAFSEALTAHNRRSARLRRQLERLEHEFIDSLATFLNRDQLHGLALLKAQTTRRQHRGWFHCPLRWTDVELRDVWNEVDPDSIVHKDARTAAELLADYELRLTPLIRRHTDTFWAISTETVGLFVALDKGEITPAEFHQRHRAVRKRHTDAGRRVARLTEQAARALAEALSPAASAEFLASARAAAFPEVYPDHSALHGLFEALKGDGALNEQTRAHVASLFRVYRDQYEQVCAEIETFCVEWGEAAADGLTGHQPQFLPEALAPLLEKRRDLARLWLEHLRRAVGDDRLTAHTDRIAPQLLEAESDREGDQVDGAAAPR